MAILLLAAEALAAYIAFSLFKFLYAEWTSPLNVLSSPKTHNYITGHLKEIWSYKSVALDKWIDEYGSTFTFRGFFGRKQFFTVDTKAVNHILMNTSVFQKPDGARYNLSRILGPGLLIVEDEKHKQQRKVMNPAFGPAQVRELTEIFVDKAILLRDILLIESKKEENQGRVDVLSWMSKMTLDVIGQAGFNYEFNALQHDDNELNKAFSQIFHNGTTVNVMNILRARYPIFRVIPADRAAEVKSARDTMARIGDKLLRDSRAAILQEAAFGEKVEKSTWKRKDLLSLLMRSNMATDLSPSQRMEDEDVLAQVPTFLVAGHETTSTATTWALFALTENLDAQRKLRDELLTVTTETPTMEELSSLPYLDAVVRETLRVHAPVPSTGRVAIKDDVIPLGTPVRGKNGELIESIEIKKGQNIMVPIEIMNKLPAFWGEDSKIFKPERWTETRVPEAASHIPGVWGNMMSFFGGPRACIGYRFSIVEMKAMLFTLVRSLQFELDVAAEDISATTTIVRRPFVISEEAKGNQLPLRIRPVQRG